MVIPDDNVGTDGFHEVLIHDMADADAPYVPVSDLTELAESIIFIYRVRYQSS